MTRSWAAPDLLDSLALAALHKRMLGQVWSWAGTWRLRETSIGVAPEAVQVALRLLLDDTRAWIEFGTFPPTRSR